LGKLAQFYIQFSEQVAIRPNQAMPNAESNGTGQAAPKFKVIIIGAGLGGCATAMAMHYQGFEVVMYEKVRKFQRLGDSLGLGENALKLLKRWGRLSFLQSPDFRCRSADCRHWQ